MFTAGNDIRYTTYTENPRANPDAEVLNEFVIQDPARPAAERISGLRGEHLDEFVIGYERLLGSSFKVVVTGMPAPNVTAGWPSCSSTIEPSIT